MEFRRSYYSATDSAAGLRALIVSVLCYRGNVVNPMWADVDTSESLLIIIYLTFFSIGNNAVASFRSTPNNDTTNSSATYQLPADYANDHNQLPQFIQVCCNATIRKPNYAHTNQGLLFSTEVFQVRYSFIIYLLIRNSAIVFLF